MMLTCLCAHMEDGQWKWRSRKKLAIVKTQVYLTAGKKKESAILEDFCEPTRYCRRYVAQTMHQAGQWYLLEEYILMADPGRHVRQHHPSRFSTVAQKVPITIWSASMFLGPVHLARAIPLFVENLITHGHPHINGEIRSLFL